MREGTCLPNASRKELEVQLVTEIPENHCVCEFRPCSASDGDGLAAHESVENTGYAAEDSERASESARASEQKRKRSQSVTEKREC